MANMQHSSKYAITRPTSNMSKLRFVPLFYAWNVLLALLILLCYSWQRSTSSVNPSYMFSRHYSSCYPYFGIEYLSPVPLFTAGLSAILSIHFNKCGNGAISSSVKPVNFHPFTHGQVPISAMLYLPFPLPARYSLGSPVYLPERRISRTP